MDVLSREHVVQLEKERQRLEADYTAVLDELGRRKVVFVFLPVLLEKVVNQSSGDFYNSFSLPGIVNWLEGAWCYITTFATLQPERSYLPSSTIMLTHSKHFY